MSKKISQEKVPELVTVDSIRFTFYNMMVCQVLENDIISNEDLSAYVILENSLDMSVKDGIQLYNGGVVNESNCPDEYKALYVALMTIRKKICDAKLNKKQIEYMRLFASSNPDIVIPHDLEQYSTYGIVAIVTVVKDLAIKISQIHNFKTIIDKVIAFCIDIKS